jgi:hypothetical protein
MLPSRPALGRDGEPVAFRHARPEELLALSRAVAEHGGTRLEAIVAGCPDQFPDEETGLFVLAMGAAVPERVPRLLGASGRAAGSWRRPCRSSPR